MTGGDGCHITPGHVLILRGLEAQQASDGAGEEAGSFTDARAQVADKSSESVIDSVHDFSSSALVESRV